MPGPNLKSHLRKEKGQAQARQKKATNRRVQKLMQDTAQAAQRKKAQSQAQRNARRATLGAAPRSTTANKSGGKTRGNLFQAIRSRRDLPGKY